MKYVDLVVFIINILDLIMNVKAVKYDSLLWQDAILTKEDKEKYQAEGYSAELTKAEFEEKFDIPAENVCYTPSVSDRTLYFNRKTLAANTFPMFMYLTDVETPNQFGLQGFYSAIREKEAEVQRGDFMGSIMSLPDSLRIEYFNMLIEKVEKENIDVKDFYTFFRDLYVLSDYGFSSLSPQTFQKIINTKTNVQKKETTKLISHLPDTVTIYRGHTEGISTPEDLAYSWTTDIRVANFFATKMGNEESEIIVATVPKDKIIEYLDDRYEDEVWVKYEDISIIERIECWGLSYLEDVLPEIQAEYLEYKEALKFIEFDMESDIHGRLHTLRVLLHCLILSHILELSEEDKHILCTAALWHDTGRTCDGIDDKHGYCGMNNYKNSVYEEEFNPITAFLIEYHSLDDKKGLSEIENNSTLNKEKKRVTCLFNTFKDSDNLDRVRLGLRDLDIHYLRNTESKHLTKIARLLLENIKE